MKRSFLVVLVLLVVAGSFFILRQPTGTSGSSANTTSEGKLNGSSAPTPVPDHEARPETQTQSPASGEHAHSHAHSPALSPSSPDDPGLPAPPRRSIPITAEQVRAMVNGPLNVSFPLPDGRSVKGILEIQKRGPGGTELGVTGRITSPGKGLFNFYLEPEGSDLGPVTGAVMIDQEEIAFNVLPGPAQTSLLTEFPVDLVVCRNYAPPPPEEATGPEEALPTEFPTTVGIPAYQNGVIPLQSAPGVTRVIYLDFDGEKGPFDGWGNFDAAPSGASNTTIKDVWVRVCQDYAPFNANITTDLQAFLNAPVSSRQRIMVTPTTDAAPGAGGVAYLNAYGSSTGRVCWSFYSSGKSAAEVIAHEIGHTLGLSHDGRTSPAEDYYLGHGTDPVGWAPIMGAGYYKNLTQWSKGEYLAANRTQDDLALIAAKLTYKPDDAGASHAAAAFLELFGTGTVDSEGNIENRTDVDAFRFATTGGAVNITVTDASTSPNLDISAALYDSSNTLILTNNPDTSITANLSTTLAAGEYTVRVDGVGRGDPLGDGYNDYASLGQYAITGTVAGAVVPDRFTIAETATSGSNVGTVTPDLNHGGSALTYAITAGNTGSAFAINSTTGQITVATPAALNYETLSSDWLDPATLDLTVSITDSVNSSLNESLRVIVSVTNVNEAPVISGSPSIAVISNTITGSALGTFTSTDPDRYDQSSYTILSGNSAGKFAINSLTGILSVNGALDSTLVSSYALTIRATDKGSPALTSDMPVTINVIPCSTAYTPGYANHTIYEGIVGTTIASLTGNAAFPNSPSREIRLTEFTDTTRGDNYGSTVRAWLIAPYTGTYQFWISGDNVAELYVNTAGTTSPLTLAGSVTTATTYQNFTASGSQTAGTHALAAGQVCYIEARHKESTSGDHLSVAWQIKDSGNVATIIPREVIPGRYLSPHYLSYNATNAVAAGTGLVEEFWDGITGTSLTTLTSLPTFPDKPNRAVDLLSFTSGIASFGDNYGSLIRAYLTPKTTGTYTFYISGDDATSLLLSTDTNPANAVQIAFKTSSSPYRKTDASASQTSAGIPLTANVRYYIEARLKEATGGDHVSVSWTGPNISSDQLVPYASLASNNSTLAPYDSNSAPVFGAPSYAFNVPSNYTLNSIAGTVTASDAAFDPLRYAILSGNSAGRFSITPSTGAIRVVDTLSPGSVYNLQVGVQDSGHGGRFTPKETAVAVAITAPGTNLPPVITADPVALGTFAAGQLMSASVASNVTNPEPGDSLAFALVSGPVWLSMSPGGTLSGTPNYNQFGPWSVIYSVNDGSNPAVQGVATFTVGNPVSNPGTLATASSATASVTTGTVLSGAQSDADTSNNSYLVLREAAASGNRSSLTAQWTFTTPVSKAALLQVEAFHSINSEGDDFQFSVSTNGGSTFNNAVLVTKTADNDASQTFAFTTGTTGSTIVRVQDTNNSPNASVLDTLSIDLLAISTPGNSTPAVSNALFVVLPTAPVGSVVGSVTATDPDAGQTLAYSIPRGNEAGLFNIDSSGQIKVNSTIPVKSGPYPLIVVATDNGSPVLAGYGTITVEVDQGTPLTVTLGNLNQTYDGNPKPVTVTMTPTTAAYAVTYNGLLDVPVDAGIYPVEVEITDPNYDGSASGSLEIEKASQAITFAPLATATFGDAPFALGATASSGLTVSYESLNSSVATVSGNMVTIVGAGNATIVASQDGDGNHEAASDELQPLTVILANPIANTGGPYTVEASASLTVDGSASQPSNGQTITAYEWDLNNDNIFGDVTGATPAAISHADLTGTWGMGVGLNTIKLKVTDSAAKTATTSTTVDLLPFLALTWDANGATASQTDGAGAWLNTGRWWDGSTNLDWGPLANAVFGNGGTGGAVTLASPTTVNALTFNNFSGTYTLGTAGQMITLGEGITKNAGSGNVTIISPVTMGAAQTWTNNAAGPLTLSGSLDTGVAASPGNHTLTLDGSGTTTLSGVVSGTGGIVKNGPGRVTFGAGSNANTYTGPTTINGGILSIANNSASLGNGNLTLNGGVLGFYWSAGLTRTLGIEDNQVRILGGQSGFGGDGSTGPTISLGATVVWGAAGEGTATGFFNPGKFVLGSADTTNTGIMTFSSAINLNGATRTILATKGLSAAGNRSTISGAISNGTGTAGLIKEGNGMLFLTSNTSAWNGATTVSEGLLDFGGINVANIGGGSGRNISVAGGAAVRFNALSNTILSRIAETGAEIAVMTGTTGNALNLSGGSGANLTGAFLGGYASNGAKTEISGVITPGGGAYRLGALGFHNGALGITQTSLLSGPNQLIIGANRVVIVGAHTFTGDTTIRDGARLGLAAFTGGTNSLGLQNSALDLGAPSATGQIFLEAGNVAAPITGSNLSSPTTLALGTVSATFGGLKGGRNLVSAFVTGGTGNNTSGTALADITGFTLNVSTGNSFSYSGAIGGFGTGPSGSTGGNSTLTKTGPGTQTLSGVNTYTGATTVSAGTLSLGTSGSIANSTSVSIAAGATLDTSGKSSHAIPASQPVGFGVDATGSGSSGKITAAALNISSATVTYNISGPLDDAAYVLATYTSLVGSNFASAPAPPIGYALQYNYQGNKIALVQIGDITPPTLTGIVDDKGGSPVAVNTPVNYTVTFSEDMDASTVTAADFGNAGTAAATIGTVTETSPTSGVFTVQATPTTPGTLQLRVNAAAVLKDVAGNNLNTTSAIPDDTVITVQGAYAFWSGGAVFNADTNGDGVMNGMAWVLGAATPTTNAIGLLPTLDNTTDPAYLIFTYPRSDAAHADAGTTIAVQYGSTLGIWATAVHDGTDIIISETDNGAIDSVQVKIKRTLAVGDKLFARLNVTIAP